MWLLPCTLLAFPTLVACNHGTRHLLWALSTLGWCRVWTCSSWLAVLRPRTQVPPVPWPQEPPAHLLHHRMGLLSTSFKEDTQELQHRVPGRMKFVCQAFFHCPAKEQHSQGHSPTIPGNNRRWYCEPQTPLTCKVEGAQEDKAES